MVLGQLKLRTSNLQENPICIQSHFPLGIIFTDKF